MFSPYEVPDQTTALCQINVNRIRPSHNRRCVTNQYLFTTGTQLSHPIQKNFSRLWHGLEQTSFKTKASRTLLTLWVTLWTFLPLDVGTKRHVNALHHFMSSTFMTLLAKSKKIHQ